MTKYHPYKRQGSSVSQQCNNMINVFTPCVRRAYPNTLHAHTLQRDAHWSRVVRDALMSFTVSDSLSDSHIPSLHHCSIVIPLCEGRSIRSCVTELLSDIRAVQMDDPTTSPWPPDKKPSLFVQPSPLLLLFFSYPSLKAQLQLFVTSLKKKFFPGFPAGPYPTAFFGPSQKNRKPCGVVTSAASHCCAVFLCSWIIGSSQRHSEW